jgi:phage/plasmid primase-like uncharacterized protein
MIAERTCLDVEDVIAGLDADAEHVLRALGLDVCKRARAYRLRECPQCRLRAKSASRGGVAIYQRHGRWRWSHYGHDCHGDLIDLIAAVHGFDRQRDWIALRDRAAQIAGVSARPLTAAQRHERDTWRAAREAERRQREAEEARLELEEQGERRRAAQAEWPQLARWHDAGEGYLRARGLDGRWLADRGLVRYSRAGDVCVPLFDYDGELATVPRRLISPRSSLKVLIPTGGTQSGTMLGRHQLASGARDVIIAEGVMDALTAAQIWPERVVLGAGGAGQLPTVARYVAPRVRRSGGHLWIIADRDDVGQARAADAIRIARAAGLAPRVDLHLIDIAPHHDLNEAHCAGWEP